MGRPSLDGMAAFVRRVCAQLESAPARPDPPPPSDRHPAPVTPAELWAFASEPPTDEPLYSHFDATAEDRAGPREHWEMAQQALAEGTVQEAMVVGWNRGGLLVQWKGLQGFLPASQLQRMIRYTTEAERDAAFARRVGEALRLRVIEVDRGRRRLVFSERALQSGLGAGECLWQSLSPGQVMRGRVRNLCDFGAFVDLGGIDGLVHISELSWHHVRHPSDVLEVGQEIDVLVMSVEPERKRVALSVKKLRQDPWENITHRYRIGQIVEVVITNVVSFGAFARVEEGVEGLIHVSELAEGNFLHPRNVIGEGEAVTARVIGIDCSNRRLALSLRQLHSLSDAGKVDSWAPHMAQ